MNMSMSHLKTDHSDTHFFTGNCFFNGNSNFF